jgi:hypothetical protein
VEAVVSLRACGEQMRDIGNPGCPGLIIEYPPFMVVPPGLNLIRVIPPLT